jgi:hypothetical protein
MAPPRVGFSTSRFWYSRIIRWATRSRCSHTFIVYDSVDAGCECVFEAGHSGLYPVPMARWLEQGNVLVALYQPHADWTEAVRWALVELDGEPYAWGALLGMAFVKLAAWFKRKARNPMLSAKANFCSEANCIIGERVPEPGLLLPPGETDPQQLMEFFERAGAKRLFP